jgi:hypothetical protein
MGRAQGERDGVLTSALASGNRVGNDLSRCWREPASRARAATVKFGLAACVPEAHAIGRTVL